MLFPHWWKLTLDFHRSRAAHNWCGMPKFLESNRLHSGCARQATTPVYPVALARALSGMATSRKLDRETFGVPRTDHRKTLLDINFRRFDPAYCSAQAKC